MRATPLLLLALAAAACAAAAARPQLTIDFCESYDRPACEDHADKCTPCRAWDRVDVCFETGIARRLPTKLFDCDFAPAPAPPEPTPPLTADCQDFKSEASLGLLLVVVWLVSGQR